MAWINGKVGSAMQARTGYILMQKAMSTVENAKMIILAMWIKTGVCNPHHCVNKKRAPVAQMT